VEFTQTLGQPIIPLVFWQFWGRAAPIPRRPELFSSGRFFGGFSYGEHHGET
jgi:hypothetical protein